MELANNIVVVMITNQFHDMPCNVLVSLVATSSGAKRFTGKAERNLPWVKQ
jgi:hypothetical protein